MIDNHSLRAKYMHLLTSRISSRICSDLSYRTSEDVANTGEGPAPRDPFRLPSLLAKKILTRPHVSVSGSLALSASTCATLAWCASPLTATLATVLLSSGSKRTGPRRCPSSLLGSDEGPKSKFLAELTTF